MERVANCRVVALKNVLLKASVRQRKVVIIYNVLWNHIIIFYLFGFVYSNIVADNSLN